MRLKSSFIIFLGVLVLGCGNKLNSSERQPLVKGVYGNPAALWKEGYDFPSLGINAVFIRSGSLDSVFLSGQEKKGYASMLNFRC